MGKSKFLGGFLAGWIGMAVMVAILIWGMIPRNTIINGYPEIPPTAQEC
jgi:hypothetical protein